MEINYNTNAISELTFVVFDWICVCVLFLISTGWFFCFVFSVSVALFDRIINKLPHHPNGFRCCWCHFSQQPLQLEPLTATMIPMPQTIHEVAQWNKFQWLTQWAKFSSTIVDAFWCTVSISSFFMAVFLVHLNSFLLSRNGPIIHYFNMYVRKCMALCVCVCCVMYTGIEEPNKWYLWFC